MCGAELEVSDAFGGGMLACSRADYKLLSIMMQAAKPRKIL